MMMADLCPGWTPACVTVVITSQPPRYSLDSGQGSARTAIIRQLLRSCCPVLPGSRVSGGQFQLDAKIFTS